MANAVVQTSSVVVLVLNSLLPTVSLCIIFQAVPILCIVLGDFVQPLSPAIPPRVTAVQPTAPRAVGRASVSCAILCLATIFLKRSRSSQNDSDRSVQVPCLLK